MRITAAELVSQIKSSQIVRVTADGQTRRDALGVVLGGVAIPYAAGAGGIGGQAHEPIASTFIADTMAEAIAAGEASVGVGTSFKAVGRTQGYAQVRARTSTGSELLYEEFTKAGLESTDPGAAGATRVGTASGSNVQADLDAKAPFSAVSAGIAAEPYPVVFRLGRDAPPHPFEYIPAPEHEMIIAGASTYDASVDLQAMLDGWTPAGGFAGTELFPVGRFALGQELRFPNWIGWRGMGRATQLYLLPDHAGPVAFRFDSDPEKRLNGPDADNFPKSRFENRLMDMDINCNHAANVERAIYAPSWNEKCGLYNILMRKIPHIALEADEFHGGSSGWALEHCEFMFDATSKVGLRFVGRGRGSPGRVIINRPQITLRNISIVGGAAPGADAADGFVGIENDNVMLAFGGANHIEKAWAGITVDGNADVRGTGWTGSDDNGLVRNMVVRKSAHTGQVDLDGVFPGSSSASRALRDDKAGMVLTDPIGGRVQVPSLPGSAWADGQFRIDTSSGTAAVGESYLRGCKSVIRDGRAGYFRITHAAPFGSGDDYYVVAEAHDDSACYAQVRASERTAGAFHIRVCKHPDGALFDPVGVSFRIFRRPGL